MLTSEIGTPIDGGGFADPINFIPLRDMAAHFGMALTIHATLNAAESFTNTSKPEQAATATAVMDTGEWLHKTADIAESSNPCLMAKASPTFASMGELTAMTTALNASHPGLNAETTTAFGLSVPARKSSETNWHSLPPVFGQTQTRFTTKPETARAFAAAQQLKKAVYSQTFIVWGGTIKRVPWLIVRPPGEPPKPGEPRYILTKKVYLMTTHDISLVRLPERYPLEASELQISLNADSRDIQFSATILGQASLNALKPEVDGTPTVVEANIDGYIWQFMIEDWGRNLQNTKRRRNVSGRSLSARLDKPFQLARAYTSTESLYAQQLALSEINSPDNMLQISGFSLSWTGADWLIPTGAYSYQNQTPAQAIAALAAAAGLMTIPAPASQGLSIKPRYKVMPWAYDIATPNLTIPASAITQATESYAIPTQANVVYIHGGNIGGILARILRTGTAGDRLAQTVQNDLITHTDAAYALGSRILAGQYQQPKLKSITLPFDNDQFPLGEVGDLLRVEMPDYNLNAIVSGYSLTATTKKVRQTLTLGEETDNVWTQFKTLLPQDPLLIGTVESVDGETVIVSLVGSGTVRIRGTAEVGNKVFIRGGKIDSIAPDLVLAGSFEV